MRKCVLDVAPFLRFLKSESGRCFPHDKDPILRYFAVRFEESAARSVFRSLLLAIKFVEETGQFQLAKRISADPTLEW